MNGSGGGIAQCDGNGGNRGSGGIGDGAGDASSGGKDRDYKNKGDENAHAGLLRAGADEGSSAAPGLACRGSGDGIPPKFQLSLLATQCQLENQDNRYKKLNMTTIAAVCRGNFPRGFALSR
jgi:hypothetical protein